MPPAPSSPTVNRRQLGGELKRLRRAAGLTAAEVARELECSETRVSRIETGKGRTAAKPDEVKQLCTLYGVTDDRKVQMLLDMLRNSQKKGWWESYEDVLPSGLEVYVGLESDARAERAWEPLLIHGLLQIPDYARAVLQAVPSNRLGDVDSLVEIRTERQKLLTRSPEPLELWAIVDEASVRRPIGGADVMRAQLAHLQTAADLPNVTIQVVPNATGSHPGLGGAFSLLEFEESDPVVYVDSPGGNLYLEKKPDLRRFVGTFDLLRAVALPPDESMALINRAAEEMQ